ncbi:MAG: hypothetical protein ACRD0W_18950 [Acidimicrobiales bacterium]
MPSRLSPPLPALAAPTTRLRQAAVVSAQAGPPRSLTMHLAGDTTTDITGVRFLDSYTPVAADTVWALQNGSDFLVIGRLEADPLFAIKPASETVTASTVLQNDDNLFVTVQAGATYHVELMLRYTAATAGDLKFAFALPAGAELVGVAHRLSTAATDVTGVTLNSLIDAGEVLAGGTGSATGALVAASLVIAGTGGVFRLQWAQNVASGTGTEIFEGSYLSLRRVA